MPWLSILMALLTFFLSGGAEKKNRTRALLAAGLAGVGTYYLTHETDWGARTLGELDGVVQPPATGVPAVDTNNNVLTQGGKEIIKPVTTTPSGTSNASGLWSTLQSWGPAGTAAVAGVGAAAVTGNTNWLLIGAVALGAVFLLK